MKLFSTVFFVFCFFVGISQSTEYVLSNGSHYTPSFSNKNKEAGFSGISAFTTNQNEVLQLSYRIKIDKEWFAWTSINPYTEDETPGRQAFEANPVFTSYDSIQFQAEGNHIPQITFRIFQPGNFAPADAEVELSQTDSIPCGCAQPLLCLRDCWCPDGSCPKDTAPALTTPSHLIIHHSAGFSDYNDYQWVVSYYWDLHVNTNGWSDIGYNWLIDPNGIIYEGRGSGVLGAHFSCMNTETAGICMIGNFMTSSPRDTAIKSLEALLAWESCDKQIDPDAVSLHNSSQLNLPNISSHRDGNSSTAPNSCASGTVCPGDSLYLLLPQIRQEVSAKACLQAFGIEEDSGNLFRIYPNPAKEYFDIDIDKDISMSLLQVTDLNGRLVKTVEISENQQRIYVNDFPAGIYLLRLNNASAGKLIIQ